MSSAGARLNVTPTVTTLAVIKSRLAGAQRGHRLLKKKADALSMRLRALLKNILPEKIISKLNNNHPAKIFSQLYTWYFQQVKLHLAIIVCLK